MKVYKPNSTSNINISSNLNSNKSFIDNYKTAPEKPIALELSISDLGSLPICIKPSSNNSNLFIYINGQVSEINIDNNVGGIFIYPSDSGNMLDKSTFTPNSRYLIWAIFNSDNSFNRFGFTRKPSCVFTAVTAGSEGLVATFTTSGIGTNNCYQFNPGGIILVRNSTGISPNFEFNYGTVHKIISETSMKILLHSGVYGGSNITTAVGGVIENYSNFKCWDGENTDTSVIENSTLIGELITSNISTPLWIRHKYESYYPIWFIYPTISRTTVGSTNSTIYLNRYSPIWTSEFHMNLYVEDSTNPINGSGNYSYAKIGGVSQILTELTPSTTDVGVTVSSFHPAVYGSQASYSVSKYGATPGSVTCTPTLLGCRDGGLRD